MKRKKKKKPDVPLWLTPKGDVRTWLGRLLGESTLKEIEADFKQLKKETK